VTRVLIVSSSPLVRAGLQNVLGTLRFDVAGSVAGVDELSQQLLETEPDVVIVDASGDLQEKILEELVASEIARESAIVLLTEDAPPGWAAEAIRSGARAILPSDVSPDQLRIAIEAALSGFVIIPSGEAAAFVPAALPSSLPLADLPEPLTKREREVLQMLASGLGNKEIAVRLSISEHTAKFHVASILGKLGASTRTEAVSIGIRRGLVLL
jgi:two-component system, NarL family, response regulator YdfI